MILLDTNAVLFLLAGHARSRALEVHFGKLAFSPIVQLELRFLEEAGKGRFRSTDPDAAIRMDERWSLDDPPMDGVIRHAMALSWTRDPFDRLITGHALYRGWRLATSDRRIIDHLPERGTLPL